MYLGIMAMIKKNYESFREYEKLLVSVLGKENEDFIADEIYGNELFDLDSILEQAKITVGDE